MKKRIFSMLLVFAMVFSMLPTYTFAAVIEYTDKETAQAETGVTALKTVTDNGDGTYTITLSVQGYTQDTSEQQDLPADIVLVVDTSTSMDAIVSRITCGGTLVERTETWYGNTYTYYECEKCGDTHNNYRQACDNTITQNRLDVAKIAAAQFANGLLDKDGVAMGLYDFSGSNRTNVALTTNKETIIQKIDDLSMPGWGDGTYYDLGLAGAQSILNSSTKEQKFVVLISDGAPTERHEGTQIARQMRQNGITIFTVGIDVDWDAEDLENIASTDENGDKLYFEASSTGDSSTALSAVLAEIQKIIESSINAGENAVMEDIVSDEFQVVESKPLPEGLTNDNGTLTWNIGSITSEEKTVSFVIEPKEPLEAGTYNTNESVTLTFEDPEGNTIIYTKSAIGDPTITIGGITITGASKTVTYNGEEQSVSDFTVEGLPSADYYVEGLTYSAAGTNVGTYNGDFDGKLVIRDENDKDVTYRFAAVLVPGALTIGQKAITIQADSASKIYDGSALTDEGYSVSGDLATGDEIVSVTVTGSRTDVGSSANIPSGAVIMDGAENVTANYSISYVNGTLTVNKDEGATIEIEGYTGIYDGQYHDGITNIIIRDGDGNVLDNDDWTITYTYDGEITDTVPQFRDAGDYMGIRVTATNPNYKDLALSASVSISRKNVTITSPTAEKVYDGTPLTGEDFTAEGFIEGEGVTFRDYASITNVGNKVNTISYDANKNTNLDNYSITRAEGTLTVTPITEEIVITADNNSKVYDGAPLTDDDYTFTGDLAEGDELAVVVEGSLTNVGVAENIVADWAIMRDGEDVSRNYANVKTVDGVLTVTRRAATLTSANASKEYDGSALTAETVEQDGFVDGEGVDVYDFASITEAGSAQNTFEYEAAPGTSLNNYTITVEYGTLQITASDDAVLTVNGYTGVYDGNAHTVDYSIAGDVEGTEWTYEYSVDGENYVEDLPDFTDVGEYTVYVKASNDNYVTLTGSAVVKITPRSVTLTSGSASRPYNGTALKAEDVTVSGQGFVEGEGAKYSNFASITYVGSVENAFDYNLTEDTKAANYTIEVVYGTLEITEYTETLTVTAKSDSKTYDGQPLSNNGYTVNVEKLVPGDSLEAVVEGTITNVGTVENVVVSVIITNSDGVNVTENYNDIDTVAGTLTVNPAQVTITSEDAEKMYDGTPLIKEEVTVTGFVGEDASLVEYSFSGSQTYVGESDNTFEYELDKETVQNYEIETVYGTLKVTPYTGEIQIFADSAEKKYDGTPLTDNGYTYTGTLVKGDSIAAAVEGSITNAGVADNKITEYAIMRGEDDVTANYANVTPVDGVLKVTARTVNLTSATDSKLYDGTPLTNDKITVDGDGFVEGEGAVYDVTGEQTNAGSSKNTFTYELNENTAEGNYSITTSEGTLTVFPVEGVVVTIRENSGVYDYDGSEYTVEGYEIISISDPLYTEDDFIFEGAAAVSAVEPGVYGMELTSDMFTNINENFENVMFVIVDGALTINPQVTVKYYLMDDKEKLTEIDYDDGEQDNPFTVPYGGSWNIVIGEEGEANYFAPEAIEYDKDTYNFNAAASSALSGEDTTGNVTVTLVYEIEEDDFFIPIIEEGSIEISKKLSAPAGFVGSTVFTFEIYRITGSKQTLAATVEIEADEKAKIRLNMGRYLIKEVGAERDGYDLSVLCSDDDRIVRVNDGRCTYVTFENVYTPALNLELDDHFAYIIGYPDNTVKPADNITRAEAATIFFRLLTDETRAAYWSQENPYSDVDADDWFNNAISTLTNAGVLNGYADGTFRPDETITRAELVKMAVTFYSFDASLYNPEFTDVAGHWAEAYIAEAASLDFINGYTDGSFKPDQAVTRAEAMKIINRTLNRVPHADHLHEDMIVWVDNMDTTAWYYAEVQEATNSHYYEWMDITYEEWVEIRPVRNWAALEQSWSDAYAG